MEAKEGIEIQAESITLASVSYQAFFRNFPKLAGMTGTAATEVSEFDGIYKLPVTVVPTNRTTSRKDNPDVVFRWVRSRLCCAGRWEERRTDTRSPYSFASSSSSTHQPCRHPSTQPTQPIHPPAPPQA